MTMMEEALNIYTMPEILEDVSTSIREAKAEMPPPRAPNNFAMEKLAFFATIWTAITRRLDALIEVKEVEATDGDDDDWSVVSVRPSS